DQIPGRSKPVVEDVLFPLKHSLLVPALAIFAATAKIRKGKPAALLQPPGRAGAPVGGIADVEAAITGHQQPLRSVLLQVFFAGNEHGNFGPVFGLEKYLLQLILAGVEGDFGLEKDFALSGPGIQTVDSPGHNEGLEAE